MLSNRAPEQLRTRRFEKKLDPRRFIRVHRSAIINLALVQEIQKQVSSYDVLLKNGDVVRVSRGDMENIRRLTY